MIPEKTKIPNEQIAINILFLLMFALLSLSVITIKSDVEWLEKEQDNIIENTLFTKRS